MSALSDALEAMGKATKGPWEWDAEMDSFDPDLEAPWLWGKSTSDVVLKYVSEHMKKEDAALIAAAPGMAAWIKKALPWLESERAYHQEMVDTLKSETGENGALTRMHIGYVSALGALLAEAKGEGK